MKQSIDAQSEMTVPAPGRSVATIAVAEGLESGHSLLRDILDQGSYRLLRVKKCSEMVELLERGAIDLVILSAHLEALAFCRKIKSDRRTELVPVVMVTGDEDIPSQIAALRAGADVLLGESLHPGVLRARIRSLLRHKRATDRLEQTETILFALAQAVEQRDRLTGGHCERLALFSLALGCALGLSWEELVALHRGGFLHDIGKVGMPDAILFKPGPLDEQEWAVMQTHPVRGEQICRPLRSLEKVLPIIRGHHEKWDGSGYPDGLKGQEIPLLARVLQLADIYDALTSVRPYKDALEPDAALGVMQEEADRGWRDPQLMEVFLKLTAEERDPAWRDAQKLQSSLDNLRAHLAEA